MNEESRQEFNQWAAEGRGEQLESHHSGFVEDTIPLMNIQPRDRILDVGCGEGWACRLLAPLAPEGAVVGIDVSDEMIRRARAKSVAYENLLFAWADTEQIPWQQDFFTHVLCVESFYYFPDPEKALREIHRVTAPGGSVWLINHLSKENELSLRWLDDPLKAPVQLLSAAEYGALFERCGFEDFARRMFPDRAPLSEDYQKRWFPDPDELRRFRELGALLLTARKPATMKEAPYGIGSEPRR
jgi:ubiquinone/menaquinone biosynthesis C-methylase UbiE